MNGIIYGIKDLSSDEIIYVGSTTDLYMRKARHRHNCFIRQMDRLVYNYIREKTDREHFDECFAYEILYSAEFETKQELRIKEDEFIKDKAPCCNQIKAFQTDDERQEYLHDYYKDYYKTNKWQEYKREYLREWRRKKKLAKESKTLILNNENNIK